MKLAVRFGLCALALGAVSGRMSPQSSVVTRDVWRFDDMQDGGGPSSGLMRDHATGAMYGTTFGGGKGYGVVYSLTESNGHQWTVTPIHMFMGTNDGAAPIGNLIEDSNGALYGVTAGGGADESGTVFKLRPPQQGSDDWFIATLYTFTHGTDGGVPAAGLIADAAGNLYGTTSKYGANGFGTVFELSPPAGMQTAWTFTTLYSFTGGQDGGAPLASLLIDSVGNLYGTASRYGTGSITGTVFELSPPAGGGSPWNETTLWQFSGPDGTYPAAPLIADKIGNLYGTTAFGGSFGQGVAFELSPPTQPGGAWTETNIWNFSIASGVAYPFSAMLADKAGTLYGVTYGYPVQNYPMAFSALYALTPPSQQGQAWAETTLSILPLATGSGVQAPLVANAHGQLFTTAQQDLKKLSESGRKVIGAIVSFAGTGFVQ